MGEAGLRHAVVAILLAAALAGCASGGAPIRAGGGAALPPLAIRTAPMTIPAPYAQLPNDTCGASPLGWLIGRSRAAIPVPTDLAHRRVTCTTCPITTDSRPDRLNILFDATSGKIARLTCG